MTDQSTASEAARALVAQRPRAQFVCVVCGESFEARVQGGSDPVRTCSDKCRYRRRYERGRAARAQPPA